MLEAKTLREFLPVEEVEDEGRVKARRSVCRGLKEQGWEMALTLQDGKRGNDFRDHTCTWHSPMLA